MYAVNSWRQLASKEEVERLEKLINRACKLGYYHDNSSTFAILSNDWAKALFQKVVDDDVQIIDTLCF